MPEAIHLDPREALVAAYRGVTGIVATLGEAQLLVATRCAGWSAVDLLVHLLFDAQRALVTLASPTDASPDTDAITYWKSFPSTGGGSLAAVRSTRIAASAYGQGDRVVAHWRETSEAVLRAAWRADLAQPVATQGHVLTVADFLDALTVEATIHSLDLVVELPEASPPDRSSMAVVRRTLDGLLGVAPPVDWDDATYALKATGRLHLSDDDRRALSSAADRFPLFA